MLPRLTFFLLISAAASALAQNAQSAIVVPELHSNGGDVSSVLKNAPADLKLLPKEPGGRTGQLWIRNLGNALLIVGQVDGGSPKFSQNKNEILARDHVEVWLASAPDVSMPPIGWGHQFGEQLLPKGPESCLVWINENTPDASNKGQLEQDCRVWAARQEQYRSVFKKLFVRQWLITPD